MSNNISRITTLLGTLSKAQSVGIAQSFRTVFYSREHFPKILGTVVFSGMVGGYCLMDSVHNNRIKRQNEMYQAAWETNHNRQHLIIKGRSNDSSEDKSFMPSPAVVRTFTRRMTKVSVRRRSTNSSSSAPTSDLGQM